MKAKTDQIMDQLRAAAKAQQPLLRQTELATQLRSVVPSSALSFALCGTDIGIDEVSLFDQFVTIRRVTNPPGVVHVCAAADKHDFDYLGVSRFTSNCRAEVSVQRLLPEHTDAFLSDYVWHNLVLLKLRGQTALFCPAAASHSWDVIAAEKATVRFIELDDVPSQIVPDAPGPITEADVEWVKSAALEAMHLRDSKTSRRFGLAFRIAYSWNHTNDVGIALVNLWVALESLFAAPTDPAGQRTARMAQRIAAWTNIVTAAQVRKIYTARCDVVHGRSVRPQSVIPPIRKSLQLLNASLIRCIEQRSRTLPDDPN